MTMESDCFCALHDFLLPNASVKQVSTKATKGKIKLK